MNQGTVMKTVLGVVVLGGLVVGTIWIGQSKKTEPLMMAPPPPPTEPLKLPPKEDNKVYSASFIRGYHDGYSGAWLAPARWMVVSEYRAGWNAGKQDRASNLPNKFNK